MKSARRVTLVGVYVLAATAGIAVALMGPEYQRELLGSRQGNVLLAAEVIFLAGLTRAVILHRGGNRLAARRWTAFATAGVVGVVGWLIAPDRVYQRAGDRVFEAEQAIIDYDQAQASPAEQGKLDMVSEQARVRALQALGARAASYEEAAIDLRYLEARNHGITYYGMNEVLSYALFVLGVSCALYGLVVREADLT